MGSMDELRSPSLPTRPAAPVIVFPSPSMLSVLQLLGTIRCPEKPRAAHELERQQLRGQWKQRLERASYETALARRRYESVDPTNRLVARTLERDWDVALAAEQKLGDDYHRAVSREPEQLSDEEKRAVRRLADDVPALWRAPSTTASDRQAIARLMLERVVILVRGTTEHADLTCHWAGGIVTRHALIRPV